MAEEAVLADKFSEELDRLLSGQTEGLDPDKELTEVLTMAKIITDSNLSGESRVRETAKEKLLKQGREKKPFFRFPQISRRTFATGCAFTFLLVAPFLFDMISKPPSEWRASQMHEGFGTNDTALFPDGTAPIDPGTGGFSPGGLVGQGTDVITPLNVRDPSAIAMGFRRGKDSKSLALLAAGRQSRASAPAGLRGLAGDQFAMAGADGSVMTGGAEVDADRRGPDYSREGYSSIRENEFLRALDHPLSTFSIDVDKASYANVRRILNESRMPPADAVRIEEMINYFNYEYPEPRGEHPFSITTELTRAPWAPKHKLVKIGLKGKSVPMDNLPPSNLVFLVDTSGSMQSRDKLPLLQKALKLLVDRMRDEDRISIVAYAGSAGLVLPSTPGSDKVKILGVIDQMTAGGSTAGGAGIDLAYKVAAENFVKGGNNRVILATDGDFNVGMSSDGELVGMIEKKRESGVFLTVLGFGTGNYQDAKMEQLANKGNGNYAYIDSIMEAKKVLVSEMGGTLLTIAKDVKLQIEFNPGRVQAYRLIGYEDRMLAARDFNDDTKDAGELGSGHTVTALYEVVPVGVKMELPGIDPLKYRKPAKGVEVSDSSELLTVKFRYKKPDGTKSLLITQTLEDAGSVVPAASADLRFAASVAGFGMLLRDSKFKGDLTYDGVLSLARQGKGVDEKGYRAEFIGLVEKAKLLDDRRPEKTELR